MEEFIDNKKTGKDSVWWLRKIGLVEGISLLVLLGIAMPLKYLADKPEAVKYVGWAHGVLFVAFMTSVVFVWISKRWAFKKVFLAVVAAFLPFGTFVFDSWLKKQEQ